MTQTPEELPRDQGLEFVEVTSQQRLQQHWPLVLTYGVVTFLFGLALAVWPDESVKVVAFLLAFQLLVAGCVRVFIALADSTVHGGAAPALGSGRWSRDRDRRAVLHRAVADGQPPGDPRWVTAASSWGSRTWPRPWSRRAPSAGSGTSSAE